jgi:drug/metabolite transporter (DMT)-like permease
VKRPANLALVLALLTVWIIWGSTYFAIRITLESMPPFGMAGARLVTAGLVIIAISKARGLAFPTAVEWRGAVLAGALMFVGGNGSVCFAEQTVSSGLVAILVSAVTLWGAVLGLIWGDRPSGRQWIGILLGLAGVVLLNFGGGLTASPVAAVALLLGSPAWALGSILGRRLPMAAGTMSSGAQMLGGGLCLCLVSLVSGEHLGPVSQASALAFVYLLVFGSILGFTAYGYLLRHASMPVATSYAYVNPVVAVLLGTGFGGEHLDAQSWAGLATLVLAVILVTWPRGAPTAAKR